MRSRSAMAVAALAVLGGLGMQAPPAPRSSPAPRPTPPPVIEGMVKGPDGKPVEGALVMAVSLTPGPERPLAARTDASGRFRIQVPRVEPQDVFVQARGLAMVRLERIRPGTPLAVALQKGGVIEGTVRDRESRPVPGARVQASARGVGVSLPWEPEAGVVEAVADGHGRYRLDGLAPGVHAVTATAPGFGRARRTNARPGTVVDLLLLPGAWISGRVVGPDGKPLKGAMVLAGPEPARYSLGRAELTDRAGRFVIAGLDPGPYAVVARYKDLAPGVVTGLRVEREAETRAEIALSPGATITGRLIGAAERPLPGRVLLQDLEGRPAPPSLTEVLRAEAGADGRFVIEHAPLGAFTLAVLGRGHAPRRIDVEVRRQERAVDLGDVVLEVGLAIRGRVRDKAGTAVANAYVSAYRRRSTLGGDSGFPEARSEADGSFMLAGLEPGGYTIGVAAPGYARVEKEADAGAENVDIVLAPGGTITGLVVDERDRLVESFTIRAETPEREHNDVKMIASTDGRFLLSDVGEGIYALRAEAPEATPGTVSGVKVAPGQATDVGKIRLGRGGLVRGVVVDAPGGPVAAATVSLRAAVPLWTSLPLQADTDASGSFEVKGVPEGKVNLTARHPDFAPAFLSAIEVTVAKEPPETRVVLTPGGRIEGWARRRDGTPLADTQILVRPMLAMEQGPDLRVPAVTPFADGSFVVEHIPPGSATVALMSSGPGPSSSIQSRSVEVRDGQTTTVDLTLRDVLVSGRVTRGGVSLAGTRVTVGQRSYAISFWGGPSGVPAPPSGPQRMTAVTAEDGSYELIAGEPGKATVTVETLDGRVRFPPREVEIPDAEAFILDLKFASLTISGVVADKETSLPVANAFLSAAPREKGARGGTGQSGPDGRFSLEVEPGAYRLSVSAEKYAPSNTEVSVDPGANPEMRIELARGAVLQGRVVDGAARSVPGMMILASPDSADGLPGSPQGAHTLPDGSYRFESLLPQAYTLATGSAAAGFAIRTGITPGGPDVVLRLRPGGLIRVTVVGPGDAPVPEAYPRITRVEGASAWLPMYGGSATDAQGTRELASPAGLVEVTVTKEKLAGRATVSVPPGGVVELRISLQEAPQKPR